MFSLLSTVDPPIIALSSRVADRRIRRSASSSFTTYKQRLRIIQMYQEPNKKCILQAAYLFPIWKTSILIVRSCQDNTNFLLSAPE